jgi:guanylate kinase
MATRFRHIFVISGPSGAGKASIMDCLLRSTSLSKVVTFATRPQRPTEQAGVDYNFVSAAEFERLASIGEVVEKVRVYGDYFYGSPKLSYDPSGPDRLIELDPEGRATFAEAHSPHVTSLFLLPPSLDDLRRRIEARHAEANLDGRLRAASQQIERASEYDYLLINDNLKVACDIARSIVVARQQDLERPTLVGFAATLATRPTPAG